MAPRISRRAVSNSRTIRRSLEAVLFWTLVYRCAALICCSHWRTRSAGPSPLLLMKVPMVLKFEIRLSIVANCLCSCCL